jgi:DNA-binding transcriptional regulator YiaG
MPNIGSLLKAEISRLSRREIRSEVASLKKASAASRRHIAALKRQVSALEKKASMLARQGARAPVESSKVTGQPLRFVAKGFKSLRKRLGLSAPQLAKLLGVSEQSIYNWETKKATPRKEQVGAIAGLRGLGKREVQQRLAEFSKKSPAKAKRAPAKRGRKRA